MRGNPTCFHGTKSIERKYCENINIDTINPELFTSDKIYGKIYREKTKILTQSIKKSFLHLAKTIEKKNVEKR